MKLLFRKSLHHLQSLTGNDCPASSLDIFGEPLIVRNVSVAARAFKIDQVIIPNDFDDVLHLVQDKFPNISIEQIDDEKSSNEFCNTDNIITPKNDTLEIPINSILRYSQDVLLAESIIYPWDFINVIKKVLQEEVTQSIISPNITIAKSSIIEGPCIIEDNVTIDDYSKIKGPIYLGKGVFVGMGSLVRNSMLNNKTRIGFNCEISKSYFGSNTKTSHHNVILDSIIGKNVWFGGYTGTANALLTGKNVQFMIGDKLTDTRTDHFGAVIGNNCAIGAQVIILPGRQVPANAQIQAGTIFGKNI